WRGAASATPLLLKLNISYQGTFLYCPHIMGQCIFEKKEGAFFFVGEYRLKETHQNVQPDADGVLRRVFVFHLGQISTTFQW
ncbi:hypothetical protein, partial [uncultured Intestinimonas sp.]|uniref:hypothetical protein n=1 Tax=uncultured Intestinimonas sp. TaxID=1689265 RepID=UPI0025FC8756